ncbi:hypothetical protein [Pseudoxanthomonas sp. SE1]|uniref:hypothetical protein n=1 Tax=Pseudoxanthomonas sp. SE1 TaxID=1664560 RepID=UPI00240E63AA|nr:hypothetical protein [Pseudoxanthomonas sp. SE1]WFC43264.1 hypothetical protein OY559_07060 [Pseudoxanthomonas sp. SE1]
MSSSKKPQTIGYWYRPLMHFALGQGPLDAFLEFRGGDRTAWRGQQTESGQIYVDAMNLWGGEKSEGGIAGHCDVMMGEPAQQPSAYLAKHLGPMQPAWRGLASLLFKGGRYGAMNPYPKPASFKVRRILRGWDNTVGDGSEGDCWYPEKAPILMDGESLPEEIVFHHGFTLGASPPSLWHLPIAISSTLRPVSGVIHMRVVPGDGALVPATNPSRWRLTHPGGDLVHDAGWVGNPADQAALDALLVASGRTDLQGPIRDRATLDDVIVLPGELEAIRTDKWLALLHSEGDAFSVELFVPPADSRFWGMNPAHIIYDSLVASSMQGEPPETINEASFVASADRLFDEGFGLCTKYNVDRETIEEFRQRICNVIGARCSRSRVDGLWYLDIIRDDYVLGDLPVLTDDDILEFEEEPGTLDDATNQVSVAWFDPVRKETRSTAPVEAQGAIHAVGAVNSETFQFPEIPVEALALRVAQRELDAKAQLPKRHRLVCNRTPYAWRIGGRFRLQAPRRGIADMVCMVGDIDAGTLRSGAIRLVSVQDVYAMPGTSYILPQPPIDPDPAPRGSPQQRLIELPYVELVATLSNADMQALPDGIGYIGAFATPPSVGLDFALYTRAVGEDYGEGTFGNWCPGFTLEEAAGYLDTTFTVAAGARLALLEVGQRLLWENEECRLDALDPETGQITLARGVADTVPVPHAAGTMLYGYDQWHAVDGRAYADGETVNAKLLTRTSTQVQPPAQAPTLTCTVAGRVHRPYPPAQFRVNAEVAPTYLFGELTVTFVDRDRLLQADQLIDSEAAGIGPEPGTTYTLRTYLNGVLDDTQSGFASGSIAVTPSGDGIVRLELESEREGLASYQMHVRQFTYTTAAAEPLQLESGELLHAETGTAFILG